MNEALPVTHDDRQHAADSPEPAAFAPNEDAAEVEAQPSLWARWTGRAAREQRLHDLDAAIDRAPEAAVNYLLRGELLLKQGERVEAAADFQRALILAEAELAVSRWGLSAQATRDRALVGLRDAR